MQNLTFVFPIESRNGFQFQKNTIIHNQISTKISCYLSSKMHWDRNFSGHVQSRLNKSDPQRLVIHTLQKSAANLFVNLKENPNDFFGYL